MKIYVLTISQNLVKCTTYEVPNTYHTFKYLENIPSNGFVNCVKIYAIIISQNLVRFLTYKFQNIHDTFMDLENNPSNGFLIV